MRAIRRSPATALVAAAVLAIPLGQPPAVAAPAVATWATTTDPCTPADTELPVIHEVQLGATAIDVSTGPVTVPVRARVTDTGGSGLASVRVVVAVGDDGSGGRWSPGREGATAHLVPADGDWWAGSITVGQWDGYESPWAVHQVWAWDNDGNYWQRQFLDYNGDRSTAPSFTIAPHAVDEEQPYLEDLVLARRVVDVREHGTGIRVTARVSDKGGAGVASVTVAGEPLARISGTAENGWWRGFVPVPRWTRNGYHRIPVVMKDNAYNGTWAYAAGMRARGMPWRYRARSVTDAEPPVVVTSRLGSTTLDVGASDGVLQVALRLTDALAGVGSVKARLVSTRYNVEYETALSRSRGTVRKGWWRGVVTVPRCTDLLGAFRLSVESADRVGNVRKTTVGPTIQVVVGQRT